MSDERVPAEDRGKHRESRSLSDAEFAIVVKA
jgi:hypothetical protein